MADEPARPTDEPRDAPVVRIPLPPPAFPPGTRRNAARRMRSSGGREYEGDESFPSDAFISPDEPIRREEFPEDAFISPDEPIAHRPPREFRDEPREPAPDFDPVLDEEWDAVTRGQGWDDEAEAGDPDEGEDGEEGEDEVQVTGMGMEPISLRGGTAPTVTLEGTVVDVADHLEALARDLRERGPTALIVRSSTPPFDAALRGLVAGFMAGREGGRD